MKLLEEYYVENRTKLVGGLSRSLGTIQDAEDVYHNAMERAVRYYDSYDQSKPFGGWFVGILRKCVYEQLQAKHNKVIEEELDEFDFQGNLCQGELEKIKRDARRVYRDYPEEQKDIIRYYVEHNYRIKDIMAITARSRNWINVIIRRFQEEMRERYERD